MPEEQTSPSVVYHLDFAGRIPRGELVHVDEGPDGQADVYFHRLHVREPVVWELNWLTLHQVGLEFWRQQWTHEGRMQEGPEDLGIAVSSWKIVPASSMPDARYIFPVEHKGSCVWLVRSGYCTVDFRNAMNATLVRIAGDGLWEQSWNEETELSIPQPHTPLIAPPLTPAHS
ncbi:hypothetical protein [Streptomyces sp. YIM S03343]